MLKNKVGDTAAPLRSPVVSELFEGWDRASVLYANWKSTDHLEAALRGETDLDVLIDTRSVDTAIRVARELGFRMFRIAVPRSYPAVWDYVAYDGVRRKWIHLHFHAQIICGDRWVKAFHLPFETALLSCREREDGLGTWRVAPALELAILLFRMNAKYPRSWHRSRRVLDEIAGLCRKAAETPIPAALEGIFGPQARAYLETVIQSGGVETRIVGRIRRAFDPRPYRRFGPAGFLARSAFRHAYRLAAEFSRRILRRYGWGRRDLPYGGHLVAFVGIDGSGKSTNIGRVRDAFASQMNVVTVFFGSGKSGASLLRKAAMALFGFKAVLSSHRSQRDAERTGAVSGTRDGRRARAPLYYLAWQYLCLRDKERALRTARRALANGRLVLADRWPQDQVPGRLDGPRLSAWKDAPGLAGRLARREADLLSGVRLLPLRQLVILSIDPETSVVRKPGELSREGAASLIADLESIAWPSQALKTVVDARRPLEVVSDEVVESVWRGILIHG